MYAADFGGPILHLLQCDITRGISLQLTCGTETILYTDKQFGLMWLCARWLQGFGQCSTDDRSNTNSEVY